MLEIISVLPESIANQIAAGEVIQRPASVLKELVENAIDAGARNIRIDMEDAGRSLLRVSDDGCGMSPMDARMAFERHATSKIHEAADLFRLRSMGFRGEALASIASVSQVELISRRAVDEVATRLIIDGSEVKEVTETAAPVGSVFTVRNLFFNVPARRRFLKSDRTEMHHLMEQFERIVLVYPEIFFSIQDDGKQVVTLPAGSLKKRICDTLGKQFEKGLIALDFQNEISSISGFLGLPETAKRRTPRQFFFVNGRYMRHPYFHKAIMTVYERLLPSGYRPNYFIYFNVDPSRIDVNIHPTKTEIKFLDEQTIFRLISIVIRQTLSKAMSMPSLEFDSKQVVDIPAYRSDEADSVYSPEIPIDPFYNPFVDPSGQKRTSEGGSRSLGANVIIPRATNWQADFDSFEKERLEGERSLLPDCSRAQTDEKFITASKQQSEQRLFSGEESVLQSQAQDVDSTTGHSLLVFEGNYIITALKSGLAIIDARRARMRVFYDNFLEKLESEANEEPPQRLLIPEVLNLSPTEAIFVEELLPELEEMGFELSPLGAGAYSLLTLPAAIKGAGGELLYDTIKSLLQKETEVPEELAQALAREMSIREVHRTQHIGSREEADSLLAALFSRPDSYFTPQGKLIFRLLSPTELKGFLG